MSSIENTVRNMSATKKMVISKMMPHDMMMMVKFAGLYDDDFKTVASLKSNDWFLMGACKEFVYNDVPDVEKFLKETGGLLTEEQFKTVCGKNPSKLLDYKLYEKMWKCEDEYVEFVKAKDAEKAKAKAEKKKWMAELPRMYFKKVIIQYGEMDYESWENSTEAEGLPDDEARKKAWAKMCKEAEAESPYELHEEDGEDDIDGEQLWEATAEVFDTTNDD